jgi:peptidoglycan/LPS O-acetylase OafA/YrhL
MLLFLSHAISQTLVSRILIWFGEASLAVFIFSGLFQGFFREVLLRVFHTTSPLPQLFLASLLTPIVPALLWYYQKQLHIVWCFRWPSGKKSAVSKPKTQTETP